MQLFSRALSEPFRLKQKLENPRGSLNGLTTARFRCIEMFIQTCLIV